MSQARPVEQEEPFDASDERQVNKRQQRANSRDLMKKEGLRRAMSTPEGRAFVYDLFEYCGLMRNPFSTHSNTMSFNAGQQSVAQKLFADIAASGLEGFWIEMNNEATTTPTTPKGTA